MFKAFVALDMIINGHDKTKEAIKSAKSGVGKLTAAVKGYGAEMAAVAGVIYGAVKVVKDLTKAYGIQQEAIIKMESALKATGKYTPELSKEIQELASQLQTTSIYGDEATLSATALLQSLGDLSGEGLKKAIPLVQDLAAGMGIDLETAASLVGKTLGSSTNALSRYGIILDATAPKTEKLAQLTEQVNSKFGGMSEALSTTYLGRVKQLGNAFGDLKETLGGLIADRLNPLIPLMLNIVNGINNWIKAKQRLRQAYDDLKKPVEEYTDAQRTEYLTSKLLVAQIKLEAATREYMAGKRSGQAKQLREAMMQQKREVESIKRIIDVWKSYIATKDDVTNKEEKNKESIEATTGAIEGYDESMVYSGERLTLYMEMLDSARRSQTMLTTAIENNTDELMTSHEWNNRISRVLSENESRYRAIKRVVEETSIATETLTTSQQNFVDATAHLATVAGSADNALKAMAKEGGAMILEALGKMLLAQAALNWFRPVRAAAMLVAGFAAIAGASYLRSLQQGGLVKAQQGYGGGDVVPAMLEPGEMVIRKEVVERNRPALEAMNSGEGMPLQVNVYLGSKLIYSEIQKAIQNRQILVSAGSVV